MKDLSIQPIKKIYVISIETRNSEDIIETHREILSRVINDDISRSARGQGQLRQTFVRVTVRYNECKCFHYVNQPR